MTEGRLTDKQEQYLIAINAFVRRSILRAYHGKIILHFDHGTPTRLGRDQLDEVDALIQFEVQQRKSTNVVTMIEF